MKTTKELTVDATRDWATACGLVERAVNTEAERIPRSVHSIRNITCRLDTYQTRLVHGLTY